MKASFMEAVVSFALSRRVSVRARSRTAPPPAPVPPKDERGAWLLCALDLHRACPKLSAVILRHRSLFSDGLLVTVRITADEGWWGRLWKKAEGTENPGVGGSIPSLPTSFFS